MKLSYCMKLSITTSRTTIVLNMSLQFLDLEPTKFLNMPHIPAMGLTNLRKFAYNSKSPEYANE